MKSFSAALLYFLSGTGNTYRVASWIGDYFQENKIETRLKSIEDADFQVDLFDSKCDLIAVLFPTHG